MDFQLIIPCYNEAKSLEAMLSRAVVAAKDAGYDAARFQLVIVDNGSADDSAAVLSELKRGPLAAWFSVVQVEKNKGYGDGILQGLKASTAAVIGWTHADEQCDPKDAFDALKRLRQTAQPERTVVKGKRHSRKAFDYVWSRMFECMVFVFLHVFIWEINAQPKVFPRSLLPELTDPPVDFAFDLYVLWRAKKAGWATLSIPVIFAPRAHGVSHWAFSFRNRLKTGMKMLRYIGSLRR